MTQSGNSTESHSVSRNGEIIFQFFENWISKNNIKHRNVFILIRLPIEIPIPVILVQGIDAENSLPDKKLCDRIVECVVGITANENNLPIKPVN